MQIPTYSAVLALAFLSIPQIACDTASNADDPTAADAGIAWPQRGVLTFSHNLSENPGIRLADGAAVIDGPDLDFYQSRVLSISTPNGARICAKGTFDSLREIPTNTDDCPGSSEATWSSRTYLSASTTHTSDESTSAGQGLLVWDKSETTLYRLRIIGDSYDAQGVSTATFDYEPVHEDAGSDPGKRCR